MSRQLKLYRVGEYKIIVDDRANYIRIPEQLVELIEKTQDRYPFIKVEEVEPKEKELDEKLKEIKKNGLGGSF